MPLALAAIVIRVFGAVSRRPPNWLRPLAAAVVLVAGVYPGASPCWMHNYFIAQEPVMLSAHSGLNFYIGNNPLATGYPKIRPG